MNFIQNIPFYTEVVLRVLLGLVQSAALMGVVVHRPKTLGCSLQVQIEPCMLPEA